MKRTNDFKIFLSMVLLLFFGQTSFAQCIGGAISTSTDETMVYTCPGDGQSDLVVFQNTGSQDSEYAYLVTDANDIILEIVDGNSFDFENAPLGECHVWGVAYTGNFLAQPGQSVFGNMFSDECYNISYKCITVFRVGVDGGNVSLSNGGGDVANICLNDGGSDLISFETTSSSANYTYVVTDENNNILAIPEFNFADLSSAPVGVCRVWGLSYTGTLIAQVGQNAATVELADNCFDLSDNFITVYRNEVDGGAVQMPSGNTYIEHCVGDGNDDIVMFTNNSSTTANYAYFITDINNNILAVSMDDSMDFDGVPAGTCLVWGMSYTGNIVAPTGTSVFSSPISDGCWDISSTAITVVRNEVNGGMLEGGPFEFTIDGNADYVSGITLTGNVGSNQAWVITDEQGNILGLPPMPGVVNFDGAGAGVCLIWSLSFEDGLQGAAVGNNASDLVGCYSLSNPITVTRTTGGPDVDGGTLAGGPFEFCVDGESDFVSGITLTGNTGTNSAWVITDPQGNILGLPPTPDAVDFDGAGAGVCLIWHLSYEMGLMGAEVGMNASDLVGNFDLSNSITVSRSATEGGTISTTEGVYNHRAVIANRLSGTISVINSATNEVIGTYDMPNGGEPMYVDYNNENNTVLVGDYNGYVVAFDGDDFSVQGSVEAGDGVFHMWISPNNQQLWINNELDKTVSVVNPTTLEQITTFSIPQDLLAAGYKPHDVIVMPDNSAAFVTMLGGDTEDYVVKYDATTFQETARQAVGQDPHVSLTDANDKLYVASQGSGEVKVLNRSDLSEVTTIAVPNAHGLGMNADGTYLYVGNISDGGTDATYTIDLSTNTLIGGGVDAPFSAPHNYAVTNDNNTMYLTHSGMLNNTVSVYSLSPTPTLITSLGVGFNPFGLATYSYMPETTELSICAGDGNSDAFEVSVEGAVGSNQGWIITDTDLNILGTPAGPTFDLEGAGAGVCLVWHISYEDGLSGMTEGMNAANLDGCYSLSNSITVNRTEVAGGTLEGGPFEFIVDGTSDFVSGITLTGNVGTNQAWVITDEQGNILGLPPTPEAVDFDGAGAGVCLIWSLSFEDGLEGAEVGMNASDLVGCYSLSNSITVTRIDEGPANGGIVINEINGNDRFEIKNTGTTTVDISNYWICDFPSYSVLSNLESECDGDLVLEPGEVVTLVSDFDISGDDGEFGLYLNTSWSDPNSIIDYVEWGSTGHTRANVAIAAGIWSSNDFVPAFPDPMSIHYDGQGDDASDWSVAMFSPCESLIENEDETELEQAAIQDMTVYPNPTKEVAMMTLDYMKDNDVEAQIYLLNAQGQVVQSRSTNLTKGNNIIEISLSNYPGGIYLLDVRAENIHETIRIVKQQM